jgi:tetratricopeptide (TPR) repeat protein
MLGDEAGAIADCEAALSENPADQFAQQIKALSLLHLHRLEAAIACFEKVTNPEAKEHMLLSTGRRIWCVRRPAKVIELLEPRWNPNCDDCAQLKTADMLLGAYDELGRGH